MSQTIHNWYYAVLLVVIIEEISYWLIYNSVEEFLNQRINVLYKTISQMKGGNIPKIDMNEDVIES